MWRYKIEKCMIQKNKIQDFYNKIQDFISKGADEFCKDDDDSKEGDALKNGNGRKDNVKNLFVIAYKKRSNKSKNSKCGSVYS